MVIPNANAADTRTDRRSRSLPRFRGPRARHIGADAPALLAAAVRCQTQVGAIAPTGAPLARLAAAQMPLAGNLTLVELGPGAGAITDHLRSLTDGETGRLFAVEANRDLYRHLRGSRPWLASTLIHGDARELVRLLADRHVQAGTVDGVVASLPWSYFAGDMQGAILHQIRCILRPGGTFTTVVTCTAALLPSARRFRRLLTEVVGPARRRGPILRNLPPAYLLTARRPGAADPIGSYDRVSLVSVPSDST